MTGPASAIKREVLRLVDAQIDVLTRNSTLTTLDLLEFEDRADRLKELFGELDDLSADAAHGWLSARHHRLKSPDDHAA